MKNVALGQYFPGSSLMHRLDPRVKLLLTIAVIVLIFFVHTYWGYLCACLLGLSGCAGHADVGRGVFAHLGQIRAQGH